MISTDKDYTEEQNSAFLLGFFVGAVVCAAVFIVPVLFSNH
jgi:hypothetical protein